MDQEEDISMKEPPTRYALLLEATSGHDLPPIVRLRRLLKLALRSCGLRCVEATEQGQSLRVDGDELLDK